MQSTVSGITTAASTGVQQRFSRASRTVPRHLQWRIFIAALVMNDLLMTGIAFWVAYYLRFQQDIPLFHLEVTPSITFYTVLIVVLIPLWLITFFSMGLYNRQNLLGGTREYAKLFNATTIGMLSVIAAGFLEPELVFSRAWLLMAWLLAFIFTAIGRFLLRRCAFLCREKGFLLSSALIVGINEEGIILAEQLCQWKASGLHLLGFIENNLQSGSPVAEGLNNLGHLADLDRIVSEKGIDEIILTTSALTREEVLCLFKSYGVNSKVNLRLSSGLFEIITTGLEVSELASVPLVRVNKARLTGLDSFLKLLLDYGITIPALLFFLPVSLLIALAIKLDSPGPVLYRRRVMGVNGQQFDAFKFRTMYVNGDDILDAFPELKARLAEDHKLLADPRITSIGRLLRKTSLDELPQLINVLRREMSLVGPRMISPAEMPKYNQWGMNLLTVHPGITGLWQVSGRSDVSYEERVRLDMHYIRNWSIWLDLELLFQTIPAVLKGRGAY